MKCRFLRLNGAQPECGYHGDELTEKEACKCIVDYWTLPHEVWECFEPDDDSAVPEANPDRHPLDDLLDLVERVQYPSQPHVKTENPEGIERETE